MQKLNITKDRAQIVDEENRITCLVIMFTPWVMVIEMSEMAYILLVQQKIS